MSAVIRVRLANIYMYKMPVVSLYLRVQDVCGYQGWDGHTSTCSLSTATGENTNLYIVIKV